MIVVLYASTSGSTASIAAEIARNIGKHCDIVDLKMLEDEHIARWTHATHLFAGTPTYGHGNWHHLWERQFDRTLPLFANARQVSLFGLGDARHHGATFSGGIGRLYDKLRDNNVLVTGSSAADKYRYKATPSLRGGAFPGFVIDHRQDHRMARAQIAEWLAQLDISPELPGNGLARSHKHKLCSGFPEQPDALQSTLVSNVG